MRVLITTQPAYGHLHPLVPTARALSQAGHEVVIASSASFQPQLNATGLRTIAAGVDWLESEPEVTFPEMVAHVQAGTIKQFTIEHIFCGRTARQMTADIIRLAETWHPDVVVREYGEFGGGIAATVLGVPCVVHGVGLWLNIEVFVEIGGMQLRTVAAEFGVSDDGLVWVDGELYLDPCPPFLQAPTRRPYPTRAQLIRPIPFDTTAGSVALPTWVDHLEGDRPLIYVGLGTVLNRRGATLETILGDLVELDAELVVTTGPGRRPEDLGPQPAHVHVEQYLPLTQLLPHCQLVVCHAGWGTMIGALDHGLPLVCVPISADGFMNAESWTASGLGRSIPARELQPGMVRDAVQSILGQPSYRDARHAQTRIADMPHPDEVVRVIEDLV